MKMRFDFVTNSSSSSYVISYSSIPEFDSETVSKYPCVQALKPLIESIMYCEPNYGDTTAGRMVATSEDLDNYLISTYGWGDYNTIEKLIEGEDISAEQYAMYTNEINSGKSLLFKRIDYSDTGLASVYRILDQADVGIKILFHD